MSENILAKFKNSPAFSFRGKLNTLNFGNNPEHLPSPHQYTPQKPVKNSINTVFTKSSRKTFFDIPAQVSPGPGQYEKYTIKDKSYQFLAKQAKNRTFSERFLQKSEQKPGPGAYEIKKDLKKTLPSFSIGKKTKNMYDIEVERNSFKQAPGAYDADSKLIKSRSMISIAKSPRLVQKQDKLPGPGMYQTNQSFQSQRSFGKRDFSTTERKPFFEMKNPSPGPGKYILESSFQSNLRKLKGFSCRKRFGDIVKKLDVPGPGNYESKSQISFRSVQSCKIAQAKRDTFGEVNSGSLVTPGPGKYQNLNETYTKLKFKSQSAPKFSKAKLDQISALKFETTDKFYDPQLALVKKSSISFSMGVQKRKNIFQKNDKLPGPGQYNYNETKLVKQPVSAPKFAQSRRHNPILNKLTVGPGQYYNPEVSSCLQKIGTKFSKGQRKTGISEISNQTKSILKITNGIQSNFSNQLN